MITADGEPVTPAFRTILAGYGLGFTGESGERAAPGAGGAP